MIWISCKRLQRWNCLAILSAILFISDVALANKEGYYGKFIGKLTQLHHGVSGEVYAVDARTLHLRNFNYDGEGPAAYFYAGNSKAPSSSGFRLRDERGTTNVLPRYVNKHITITLPEGKTLQNIRWFSVWCDEFAVNFGDVRISKNLDFPRPQKIGALNGVHGVSSDQIVIVDAQTLLIPNFSYDGEAPDAKFWVGRGPKPSPQGIRVPDENGKELPLRRYDRKTIVLTLPGDLTVFDIGHFGVWCEAFTVDFGHVQLPRGVNVPPSLKMLGVSPQKRSRSLDLPINVQNPQFDNPFGNQEPRQQNLNRPIFYHDFKSQPQNLQEIRPTTYKPQFFRPVPQQINNDVFEIQRSISLPTNNHEFVINEHTGDFVKPQQQFQIQHSRREEIRYQPTPAEKILQANPTEPTPQNQDSYQNNGLVFTPQPIGPIAQQPIGPIAQQPIGPIAPQPVAPIAPIPQQTILTQEQNINQEIGTILVPPQPVYQQNYQQQQFVQQQYQPQPSNIYEQRATNHFGTIFNQQNVEANINHTPELGSGSFSRFVINRSTGQGGFYHRY